MEELVAQSQRTPGPRQVDLTETGQAKFVICDYTIEQGFRYFKRTLGGLHLLSSSKTGVTIQFYALLITALLQLHLKQRCVATYEMVSEQGTLGRLEIDLEEVIERSGSTFLATVGQKLQRWWKISIHWLVHLRNYLGRCLDEQGVYLLGTT